MHRVIYIFASRKCHNILKTPKKFYTIAQHCLPQAQDNGLFTLNDNKKHHIVDNKTEHTKKYEQRKRHCNWDTVLNRSIVITKTRLFKYIENFISKNWKFSNKKLWYFSYFCSKHRLWVSLEPPRRGGSNEYPQSMLLSRNKQIMCTPVNPSFTI